MIEELKPCPFCGGKAYIDTWLRPHIECMHKKKCIAKPDTFLTAESFNYDIERQVKAWNRRINERE